MKSMKSVTPRKHSRSLRLCAMCAALALALAAPALASGDIAYDLNGSLEAADPAAVEARIQQEEAAGVTDMNTADVVMGYIAPEGAALSPVSCTQLSLVSVNQLMFESVVDLDENLKPVPMLADSWEQEGNNWTFKLRSGIQFHNGVELTAYDVVRSFETLVTSFEENPYYGRLSMITSMEATDIHTLAVVGKTSGLSTLYAMNFPVMQYQTLADDIPRGTGPYWFIQRDPDDTIRLESNPLWWKQQPAVGSILLKRFDDAGDAIQAIQTNRVQMVSTVSPKAAFSRKLADLTSMDFITMTYEMLIPNLSDASLLSNVNVRQAVMYAIDRSVIASNAYVDMAVQCEVPVPPTSWLYESQSAIYYYSPERALQLMHNLGWYDITGNGKLNRMDGIMVQEPNLTLVTYNESTNSMRENAANLIAGYLEAIGFNVRVNVVTQARVRELIRSRNFDLALVGFNLSEVPSLSPLLGRGGALNLNGFGNDDMESLLNLASLASDESTLRKAYSDMQLYIVDRLPLMGLLFRTGTVLSARSLGGMSNLRCYDAFNGFEFLEK